MPAGPTPLSPAGEGTRHTRRRCRLGARAEPHGYVALQVVRCGSGRRGSSAGLELVRMAGAFDQKFNVLNF